MAKPKLVISNVAFGDDGIAVTYSDVNNDFRGQLMQQRTLMMSSAHPDYSDDITELHDRVVAVLCNALEDWGDSTPEAPTGEGEASDPRGMGFGD